MISMAENGRNLNVVEVGREDMALFEVKRERLSGSEARRELEGLREKAEALGTKKRIHLYLIAREVTGRKPGEAYDLKDLEEILRGSKASYFPKT